MSRVFEIEGLIAKGGMPIAAFILGLVLNKVAIHWTMISIFIIIVPILLLFNQCLAKANSPELSEA
jgi:DHA3 family macrolide efflux protein-like MFS transporter